MDAPRFDDIFFVADERDGHEIDPRFGTETDIVAIFVREGVKSDIGFGEVDPFALHQPSRCQNLQNRFSTMFLDDTGLDGTVGEVNRIAGFEIFDHFGKTDTKSVTVRFGRQGDGIPFLDIQRFQ